MLTVKQVAAGLGVDENWVYERAASGEIPSYKIGGLRRFRTSEVEEWLQRHHVVRTVFAPVRAVRK